MSMLGRGANAIAILESLSASQATIEFDLSGKIMTANENFCRTLGYQLSEIVGRHHSMFLEPAYGKSAVYSSFWHKLAAGKFDQGQYKRIGKVAERSGSRHLTIRFFAAVNRSRL